MDTLPPGLPARITLEQLAQWLRVSPRTVRQLTKTGGLPPPVSVGRRLLWDPAEVSAHLDARREGATHGP